MKNRKNLGCRIKGAKERGAWAELYFMALAASQGHCREDAETANAEQIQCAGREGYVPGENDVPGAFQG